VTATTAGVARRTTMRAILQTEYGSADVLRLGEIDRPAAADNEVLVRVHAAGLDRGTWHLMAGDASVIPAIAASLQRIPAGVPVHVLIEVAGPQEKQPLSSPGDLHLTWLHREPVADAVAALDFPPGRVHAFVHGEASAVRAIRRHLLVDRGLPREALSISGYWKRTRTEEGWREDKPEWNRLVEQDATAA